MDCGMIRQYGMQAIGMLKENRLISMISIIGTAVAIAMIMVVVFVLQIQWVNYYPEYHQGTGRYRCSPCGSLTRMETLAGDPWAWSR